jgi:hypothetical protein
MAQQNSPSFIVAEFLGDNFSDLDAQSITQLLSQVRMGRS